MHKTSGEIELSIAPPSAEEYRELMRSVGFTAFSADAAAKSLERSFFTVSLRKAGALVGMGRLIGDGVCFVEVVDVAVAPDYQRQGLGRRIMEALMAHANAELAEGAFVSLSAHVPANRLYAGFGFVETAPEAVGMVYRVGGADS